MTSGSQHKLIVSYTQLADYLAGRRDVALRSIYEGKSFKPTKEMRDGEKYHKQWALSTKLNRRMPTVFGGEPIIDPFVEQRFRVELTEWLIVDGTPDSIGGKMRWCGKLWKTIVELKSGVGSSASYANKDQIYAYQIFDPDAKMARVYRYNQYLDQCSLDLAYLDKRTLERGVRFYIETADMVRADRYMNNQKWWNYVQN